MPARRILILTQNHLAAYRAERGTAVRENEFTLDEQGQSDFRDWLSLHRNALIQLLADLPDEVFHQETLPHVIGGDRKALLTRKVNQHLFGTPYTLTRSLGREKLGRRDERFLFAGLTRPQALEPWVLAMHEAGVALAGIYSPAMLLSPLLGRNPANTERYILITLGSGGLRQSYFEQGQLRFSRLKPLTTNNVEEAAVSAYGEAVRIYQYLVGQRIITRGQKVPVHCLARPDHFELLRQACADTDELTFHFESLADVANTKHVTAAPGELLLDTLLINLLQRHPPSTQFGNNEARIDYRRWQWRSAINGGAIVLLALTALCVMGAAISVWLSQSRTADATAAALDAKQQYASLVQSLPAIPISPEQLRNLHEQWQQLKAHSPDFARTLQPISAALEENRKVELKALDWRLGNTPDDSTTSLGADLWLIIDIEAQLPATVGDDRRAQNDKIERFVAALQRSPEDHARILQRPFDTDSTRSLKGSSEAYNGTEGINFTVRYWRKTES